MPDLSYGSDKRQSRTGPRSVILDLLDRFCDKVYDWLKNGMFGSLFTKYPDIDNTLFSRAAESSFRKNVISPARRRVAEKMETSFFAGMYTKFISWLLCVRLRVYGIFLISFLLYSALFSAVGFFRFSRGDFIDVALPACLSLAALPLVISPDTLASALGKSKLGSFAVRFTGNTLEALDTKRRCGRTNAAFLLGLVLGILTYFVSPLYIGLGMMALVFCALVVATPEFGTVSLFFFMPILPTEILIVLAALAMISFLLKVLLGKRVLRVEALDIVLFPFLLTLLTGTVFGVTKSSILSGSMTIVFTMCFYLVVFSLTTRIWLRRAVLALVSSATLISFYGMFQYVSTKVAETSGWVDQEMFAYIKGRAVATLDNPNMLAVYLIIVLPICVSFMLNNVGGLRAKAIALVCTASVGFCLIFTWTRGAWLGMLIAAVVFVMIWSRKSIYMFLGGICAIPFLPYVIPDSIWNRFTSIGNTADSSTSYRISILKSVFELLPDYILYGFGYGEDSWYAIYPKIAISGVEWTAHSHNLYLQIWVQTGFLSLILFLIFAVLLFTSNFKFYKRLSDISDSVVSKISVGPMKDAAFSEITPISEEITDSKVRSGKIKTVMRLEAAGPLCGVLAALLMGFTDYIWYNYRVYLVFWLVCGLSSAFARISQRDLDKYSAENMGEDESCSSVDIRLEKKSRKDRANGKT